MENMDKSLQKLRQSSIRLFLKAEKAKVTDKEGLTLVTAESQAKGLEIAKKILYLLTEKNPNTVLFLSGGKTPEDLYRQLAEEKRLKVKAVAMVDERFGPRLHDNSNEKMIKNTGLLDYLKSQTIPFYPIILGEAQYAPNGVNDNGRSVETQQWLANNYSRIFFPEAVDEGSKFEFTKKIAILGIGKDGHTAGIAPNRKDFTNPLFSESLYVGSFNDPKSMEQGGFGTRITLTFEALRQMDTLLVLGFGKEKKETIGRMFERGSLEEIPARFYVSKPQIAQRTILITDQKI